MYLRKQFCLLCINFTFPWKILVFKFINNSFCKSKTFCVPVLKMINFKFNRECMFIWEIIWGPKPALSWLWVRSWLGKILVRTFSVLDRIVFLNCTVPNNKVKVNVTNKNFCKYKTYIWHKLKGKGCKKNVSDL